MFEHLIGLKNRSSDELVSVLDNSETFLDDEGNPTVPPDCVDALAGRSIGLLFFEPSTRTRVSFQYATHKLGGYPLFLSDQNSSVRKGESVLDTCRNLAAMGFDGLVIRHDDRNLPFSLAEKVDIPIINAGNGSGEHPTQALVDALTLRRAFGRGTGNDLQGLNVSIIGDVVHSRVARSDVHALQTLGANVTLAGPQRLLPRNTDEDWGARMVHSRREALEGADAVIVLRIKTEKIHGDVIDTNTFIRDWGIDEAVVDEEMGPQTRILHPGPVIRGVELTDAVADGPSSLIFDQVAKGVAVRMAILVEMIGA
jgi:aspartate carbamoyltransferase catalytic subunit